MVARNQLYPPCTTLPTDEGWIPALQAEIAELEANVTRLTEALERAERERAVLQERYDCNTAIMRARTEKMNEFERSARLAGERAGRMREALAFAESVIKSGEPWTVSCEDKFRAALDQTPAQDGTDAL